jgi:hypothetical protein
MWPRVQRQDTQRDLVRIRAAENQVSSRRRRRLGFVHVTRSGLRQTFRRAPIDRLPEDRGIAAAIELKHHPGPIA